MISKSKLSDMAVHARRASARQASTLSSEPSEALWPVSPPSRSTVLNNEARRVAIDSDCGLPVSNGRLERPLPVAPVMPRLPATRTVERAAERAGRGALQTAQPLIEQRLLERVEQLRGRARGLERSGCGSERVEGAGERSVERRLEIDLTRQRQRLNEHRRIADRRDRGDGHLQVGF
jgi:hypothetical protein